MAVDTLECTALKFRVQNFEELQCIAVTGVVKAEGRVRTTLLLAGSLIRLDIQEIEGLNSMIKTTVARSQNNRISLALLSSRVCMRKVIALNTGGSTRVKDIKPYAASLARSAYLFDESHHAILNDDNRWKAPTSSSSALTLPQASDSLFDPRQDCSLEESRWAIKYHRAFMKSFKVSWLVKGAQPENVQALVTPSPANAAVKEYWVPCTVAHSQVVMARLELQCPAVKTRYVLADLQLTQEAVCRTSFSIIMSMCSLAEKAKSAGRSRVQLHTQKMEIKEVDGACSFNCVGRKKLLCELRARYVHNKKHERKTRAAGEAIGDVQGEPGEPAEGAENADQVEVEAEDVCLKSDGSDNDEGHGVEQKQEDQEIMRMLYGGHEEGSDGDLSELADEDRLELNNLVDLNLEVASACANRVAQEPDATVSAVAERIQQRRESDAFGSSSGTLADAEQSQEALLQELLSGSSLLSPDAEAGDADTSNEAACLQQCEGMDAMSASQIPPTLEDAFLEKWHASAAAMIDALVHRRAHAADEVGANKEMSLVLEIQDETACVHLVHWSSSNIAHGRTVKLDEEDRIVCSMPFLQKARDFTHAGVHMVLPAVGECMRKVKKHERAPLPKHALRLMNMYKKAIACHCHEAESDLCFEPVPDVSDAMCLACHSSGNCKVCAFCGLTAHRVCSARLFCKCDEKRMRVSLDRADVQLDIIPNILLADDAATEREEKDEPLSPWQSLLAFSSEKLRTGVTSSCLVRVGSHGLTCRLTVCEA